MRQTRLESTIAAACALLSPRAVYARDVIEGRQAWSGSDLRGKAGQFSSRYAKQRSHARVCLVAVGGSIVPVGQRGKQITAVRLCVDDFGNEVYETLNGLAYPAGRYYAIQP